MIRAKYEAARRADFSMKLGPSGAVTCVTIRCTTGAKPPTVKMGLDVPPRREVGIDQRPQCREEMSMRQVRLTRAVADANVTALVTVARCWVLMRRDMPVNRERPPGCDGKTFAEDWRIL